MTEIVVQTDTLWEILLKLKLHDIVDVCTNSDAVNKFCKNEKFWEERVHIEYPGYVKPVNQKWSEVCVYLAKNKRKVVSIVLNTHQKKELEKFNIDPYTTFDRLLGYVNKKYNIFAINTTNNDVYSIDVTGLQTKLESLNYGTSIAIVRNDFLYHIILPDGQNLYTSIESIDVM